MAFKDLDTRTRYDIIRAGVRAGITKVSDIERLFDEGGDINYINNPTEANRAVVMGQIGENPELLFTPEYSQWRNYIMKNSPKYLDKLWNDLSYEKQQQIFKSNPKAFSALSNEAQAAFAGNKVREATDKAAPYAAAIPLAGAGLMTALNLGAGNAITSITKQGIKNAIKSGIESEIGAKAVDKTLEATTGSSYTDFVSDMIDIGFDKDPRNSVVGRTLVEMSNPGFIAGGNFIFNPIKNARFIKQKGWKESENTLKKYFTEWMQKNPEYFESKYFNNDPNGLINLRYKTPEQIVNKIDASPINYITYGERKNILKPNTYDWDLIMNARAYNEQLNILSAQHTIRINPLSFFQNPNRFKGLISHELGHSYSKLWNKKGSLVDLDDIGDYYIANKEFLKPELLKPFTKNEGWTSSPEELYAEMLNWKTQKGLQLDSKFKDLTKDQQKFFIENASKRFNLSKTDAQNTMQGLSELGYF